MSVVLRHSYNLWGTGGLSDPQVISLYANCSRVVVSESAQWHPAILTGLYAEGVKLYAYYSSINKPTADEGGSGSYPGTASRFPIPRSVIVANNLWLYNTDGSIRVEVATGNQFLDPSKKGTVGVDAGLTLGQMYLKYLLARLVSAYPAGVLTGVILDYMIPGIYSWGGWTPGTITNFATDSGTVPTWWASWIPFLTTVCNGLKAAGYVVVLNNAGIYGASDPAGHLAAQRALANENIMEDGVFTYGGAYISASYLATNVAGLAGDPLPVWFSAAGIKSSDPAFQTKFRYNYAVYKLGENATTFFNVAGPGVPWTDPLFSVDLGIATGIYTQADPTKSQYERLFTLGRVCVNGDLALNYTLALGSNYYVDLGGTGYTGNVTVLPQTALILKAVAAPTVAITSPTTGGAYSANTNSVTLSGAASVGSGLTFTTVAWANSAGGSGSCTGTTSWSTGAITLYAGANTIIVTVTDSASQVTTATIVVTYNSAAPVVGITNPSNATTYATQSSSINMSGTASAATGLSLTGVSWLNSAGGAGTCTGTTAWAAANILLQPGANVITITAVDSFGATGISTLSVFYTVPTPYIPTGQSTRNLAGLISMARFMADEIVSGSILDNSDDQFDLTTMVQLAYEQYAKDTVCYPCFYTISAVANQAIYPFSSFGGFDPTDYSRFGISAGCGARIFKLQKVYYNQLPLVRTTEAELTQMNYMWPFDAAGTPEWWMPYGDSGIRLYYIAGDTLPIYISGWETPNLDQFSDPTDEPLIHPSRRELLAIRAALYIVERLLERPEVQPKYQDLLRRYNAGILQASEEVNSADEIIQYGKHTGHGSTGMSYARTIVPAP